jgi:hypothetical protein
MGRQVNCSCFRAIFEKEEMRHRFGAVFGRHLVQPPKIAETGAAAP